MSAAWHKILAAIGICNKVIQVRDATLDVEVSNIETLLEDLMMLRSKWKGIWNEAKEVALNVKMKIKSCHGWQGLLCHYYYYANYAMDGIIEIM